MEKTISSILYPIYKFNTLAKIWEELQMKEIPTIFYPKPTIKFITYNVWFEEYDFVERAEELAKILEKSSPDYICLHEIKPFYGYTVMILAKYPFGLYNIPYPTGMDRSLLIAAAKIADKTIAVATSHFESLAPNEGLREKQLQIAFKELKKFEFACLMGDFNFDNLKEDARIDKEFQDVWKELKDLRKDPGYTMPPDDYYGYSAWRPDKFLLKTHSNFKAKSIEIIGTDPIPKYKGNKPDVPAEILECKEKKNLKDLLKIDAKSSHVHTPSDHYGLEVIVEMV